MGCILLQLSATIVSGELQRERVWSAPFNGLCNRFEIAKLGRRNIHHIDAQVQSNISWLETLLRVSLKKMLVYTAPATRLGPLCSTVAAKVPVWARRRSDARRDSCVRYGPRWCAV